MLCRIRFIMPAFTILISLFTLQAAHASTIQLPQTGQTVCYDAAYQSTDCANTTGQDANILAGKPSPNPRFTINKLGDGTTEDGTVTDNLTGLIWLKDAGCFSTVGGITKGTTVGTSYLTWPNALTWSNNLKGDADGTLCGLKDSSVAGDWRLPNITELESLVDAQRFSPALPTGYPFINVQSNWYWSSSTYVSSTSGAWVMDMIAGLVNSGSKGGNYYVWPVRAGQ